MSSDNVGKQISRFKRERIAEIYRKEPDLPIWAFEERFDVARGTLRAIFRAVDRELRGTKKRNKVGKGKVRSRQQ